MSFLLTSAWQGGASRRCKKLIPTSFAPTKTLLQTANIAITNFGILFTLHGEVAAEEKYVFLYATFIERGSPEKYDMISIGAVITTIYE